MSLVESVLLLGALIVAGAFFALAEISFAASRPTRLEALAEAGDARAGEVLRMREQPGDYFAVVQIGLNVVALLGGIVGDEVFGAPFAGLFMWLMPEAAARLAGLAVSVAIMTALFLMLSDLLPKRWGMAEPERIAVRLIRPMRFLIMALKPFVWLFGRATEALMRLLGLPTERDEKVTAEDVLAMAEAGARSGALERKEHRVIENVFEMDSRSVTTAMTPRDRIAWFRRDDPESVVRARIAAEPYSTYPVCDGDLDHPIGYVDAKDLFQRVLNAQSFTLTDPTLLRKLLVLPDQLTLAEALDAFRQAHEDFALIVNEYAVVVGVLTLNDVMSTVMGELVSPIDEELIARRDDGSWLIDGVAPMAEVLRALEIEETPPEPEAYETLAGFLMHELRRVPRRTDVVEWAGLRFEVMDVDAFRIDQVLVTRMSATPPESPLPH
ncbi:MAG: hemolysin family protein [Casimicrobiaceae bacterium]|nr:hemolysin family protein [Casimicrobiaceae bacterium]MDW8313135.1 hemolysin family protein [Burkholderiales bacterium]